MSRPRKDFPSYRFHSSTKQAIVTLTSPSGERRDVLLGPYNSPQSKQKYDETINRWVANGRSLENLESSGSLSNNELLVRFLEYAQAKYETRGKETSSELENLRTVIGIVKSLYGTEPCSQFSAKRLKCCRAKMLEKDWCRSHINRQVNRIRRIFRWATSEELVGAEIPYGLATIRPLERGEQGVREKPKVKPVDEAFVLESMKHMQPVVADMVQLMLLTGCRAGEIVIARTCDFEDAGDLLLFRPGYHKTERYGHTRVIYCGPKSISILKKWLKPKNREAFIFSPKEAEEARRSIQSENRKTPLWPSHMKRNKLRKKRNPKKVPQDRYTVDSLRRAITYSCDKLDRIARKAKGDNRWYVKAEEKIIKAWHPHQLRHTAASNIRKQYGIEMARLILGHQTLQASEVYAELNIEKAREIVCQIG